MALKFEQNRCRFLANRATARIFFSYNEITG
jgi:hypothetical protein